MLQPGLKFDFGDEGQGFLALSGAAASDWALSGDSSWNHPALPHWYLPGPVADLRSGHQPGLIFLRSEQFGHGALLLHFTYRLTDVRDSFDITVAVNGVPATKVVRKKDASAGTIDFVGCVPGATAEADASLVSYSRQTFGRALPPFGPICPASSCFHSWHLRLTPRFVASLGVR